MNDDGPIIIIEDDHDDEQMLRDIFAELGTINELVFIENGRLALQYLENPDVRPFLILSDINLPLMSGFEVRKAIDQHEDVRIRCIPYIFLTTASTTSTVADAYAMSVQGFFTKPLTFKELRETITCILHYWTRGKAPNHV